MMKPLHALLLISSCCGGTVAQQQQQDNHDCEGGACPFDLNQDLTNGAPSTCGMWLGPSNVKRAFNHGFGLGMFTGKAIQKGTTIEPLYNGGKGTVGEPLLPFYGAEKIYQMHSPLREYIWDEDNMPEVAVEYPVGLTALFVPGLAAIAPCTAVNYNLAVLGAGKEDGKRQSVASSTSIKDTGAYAVRHNVTYYAVRDIVAGEELTVQCDDDNYDGGAYFLSQYDPEDERMTCLDNNLRVDRSLLQGHGLFAKRRLEKDTTVLSSPVLPIHALELEISLEQEINEDQLMLNYAFGHPDSDLLWLPYGPLMSYINHSPQANARVQWHSGPGNDERHARQQYHHPELFDMLAETVAKTHGKSLTLDIVPLRSIAAGEEVTIDYGNEWVDAYFKHYQAQHVNQLVHPRDPNYIAAEDFLSRQPKPLQYKTMVEQLHHPYPDNLETFCFYALPDLMDDEEHDHLHKHKHVHSHPWQADEDHECFRPCEIMERSLDNKTYTVQFQSSDDRRVIDHCILDDHEIEIWTQVPATAIRIVDRPYSTEVFSQDSFRMEMGLPDDMVPANWKRKFKQLRGRGHNSMGSKFVPFEGDQFKRKNTVVEIKVKGGMVKEGE